MANFGKKFHSRIKRNQDPWGVSLYSIYPRDSCRPCLFWRYKSFISINFAQVCTIRITNSFGEQCVWHTYAKLIEIKLLYLQKRHAVHESLGKMESNDTPHGSGFGLFLIWKFLPKFATFFEQKDYVAIHFKNWSPKSFTVE